MTIKYPTAYYEVNVVVDELVTVVQDLLNEQLVGVYLHGSLALGDFDPQQSDIDFVVVTADEMASDTIAALATMHRQLVSRHPRWGSELEGTYVWQSAIRRYEPDKAVFPHIERGGTILIEPHLTDWVIQCYVLREQGLTLTGPQPQTLIDPISTVELQQAVIALLNSWWAPQLEDTHRLEQSGYQIYAILTMCRILYTLAHGTIVSKPAAARWVQVTLDKRWGALVEHALQHHTDEATLNETINFIRFTLHSAHEATPSTINN